LEEGADVQDDPRSRPTPRTRCTSKAAASEGVVVYFSMRGDDDHFYDFMNDDLTLRREISIQDFDRDFQNWSKK
jgi:hypothetical protein